MPTPLSSPLPISAAPKFPAPKFSAGAARPMLSRVAESMYWMSRYVERAEHVARIVLVNDAVLTDVGEVSPVLRRRLWQGVFRILNLDPTPQAAALLDLDDGTMAPKIAAHLAFDPDLPNSLLSCITKARENARSIREIISSEMWEALNVLYWGIRAEDARLRFDESPQDLLRQVMGGSFLFQGQTNQTISHNQGWHFIQLGKYLERIDITCRILDSKFETLTEAEKTLDVPVRNIHWMAVLRSCCSIEAYRRMNPGEMDPMAVAAFLLLEAHFPRSIAYGVRHAHEAVVAIREGIAGPAVTAAQRILGRLKAELENAEVSEIDAAGVRPYLRQAQEKAAAAAQAVQKAYFLR